VLSHREALVPCEQISTVINIQLSYDIPILTASQGPGWFRVESRKEKKILLKFNVFMDLQVAILNLIRRNVLWSQGKVERKKQIC
jgi:hypothetical protein